MKRDIICLEGGGKEGGIKEIKARKVETFKAEYRHEEVDVLLG